MECSSDGSVYYFRGDHRECIRGPQKIYKEENEDADSHETERMCRPLREKSDKFRVNGLLVPESPGSCLLTLTNGMSTE